MEFDFRETPEGDSLSRILTGLTGLSTGEILTVLLPGDPESIIASIRTIHGTSYDMTKLRWGTKDIPWVFHAKKSLRPSAYTPQS